jgi:D-xylose 1-dehydrogenase
MTQTFKLTNEYPSLHRKKIIVTGGASGIGEAITRNLVIQGAVVSIFDIDEQAGIELSAELGCHFFMCDVSQPQQIQKSISEAHHKMEGLNALINNAANDARHAWQEVTPEYWQQAINTNLGSQFFAMQSAAKLMKSGSSIVNLGSVSWMRRRSGMVAYTSSKAGIHGMTRTMAQELGPLGIRVNSVVPGAIKTPKQERLVVTPELEKHFIDTQALKFRLIAEDVAAMVLFLVSDDSRACAGQAFIVDAGLS